ncbi:MAG TPA: prolyl oligopeptidase family serine peptidase [Bacteroidales bacterium]|nr:prolyl oligopeptidase family serine peptidase [Bacteroidales bacterium]HPF02375.1 prolyl oligopeptidase family serine peptidase [Bacteroidales bacterium]HPJ58942.1 prolyl oligopeptidase family serine peptidase [Bacteroidales bacterium]HPR12196.1 prolyl oligopeptidase family serine peptidase [Bacteroidales bacterium]HRW84879.1 prolyl oligopeptidase family serine peptidase [Bacteroidales bacterium]
MTRLIFLLSIAALMAACKNKLPETITYPATRTGDVVDTIFGTPLPDPYRWLEDDMSEETAAWVKAQNLVTFGYLEKIPFREAVRKRLTDMWNYEKFGMPFREGDYIYFAKNDGLQNQYVYYRQKEGGEQELFLDPNTFSADGTTSLSEMGFSKDGSLLAYSISEGGSDWRKIIVMDAVSKESMGDTIVDAKFTGIAWKGNEGFYYSTYDKPDGSQLSAMTDHHKLYYHKIGTSQSDDEIVFGSDLKRRYVNGYLTEDHRYLIVTASISTTGNELYIKDLSENNSPFRIMADDFDSDSYVIDNEGPTLFIHTNHNAPNRKIVTVDAKNPGMANWVDFIPESEDVLEPSTGAGYIFASYLKDAISKVYQYDKSGKMIREIELPGPGSAGGFSGKKDDGEIYYSFTNYITPSSIFRLDPVSGEASVYKKPDVDFNGDEYISEQVFYTSKDGTKIPMIITYRKGTPLNGKNPAMLYGYGGFSISSTPGFSITTAWWLENGGIYAVPNIRGGGEYGEKWHLAGTKMNKQNVFDDFIAAAEYLINNKYTSPEYLSIRGGSNGGLLVGAVMTQRPELFRVALPAVGVMDMLRYHKFTAGAGWAYDYGTADDNPEMFRYLLGYSPVHNIREGVEYPATLVTTGDHDDRVVPAHSFKFAARLQSKQAGKAPVLIRIETMAGHGAGTPVSKTIEQYADIFSFTLWNMGIKKIK